MSDLGHAAATVKRRPSSSTVLIGLPLIGVVLGAVLALAVGAGTPKKTSSPVAATPAVAVVAAGDLRVTLPAGWTRSRKGPAIPGFRGVETAFMRSWAGDVVVALLPAQQASLLPLRLDAATTAASRAAKPLIAREGTVSGYEYVRAAKGKGALDIVVVPTTRGIATIACSSQEVAPGECSQALRGLRVAHGSVLPLGPESAFLSALPGVTTALDAQRLRLRTRLTRAGLAAGAARTAYRLAGSYGAASRALRPLTKPHTDARSTWILLRRVRSRYFSLASAIRAGDRRAFKAAARSIEINDRRLTARLAAWQRALRPATG